MIAITETVTKEEIEEVGIINTKLTMEEDQRKFLAVKKHLEKRKGVNTYTGVIRELLSFYIRRSPSYNLGK